MRRCILLIGLCSCAWAQENKQALETVGHIASVMLDGDTCLQIQTPRSAKFATLKDARDPWRAADNYDVHAAAFIQTKKTLIRLAHLCKETCDVNLWMPSAGQPGRVQIVIRNVHEISQFWKWGDMDQPAPEEMKRVLEKGEQVVVQGKPGMTSVLSPIRDSLGAVVALAEVVGQTAADPRENVK